MRFFIVFLFLSALGFESYGQLVRRKDYDAAFALQAGGGTGLLTTFHHPGLSFSPTAGLKMTFPFSRKWFLGCEINYEPLKYQASRQVNTPLPAPGESIPFRGEQKAKFDLKQIFVPVYLKYMLNCNKASVFVGLYGSYIYDAQLTTHLAGTSGDGTETSWEADMSGLLEDWNAGIVIGYEHRLAKHLNIMCRVNAGVKEILKDQTLFKDKLFPASVCVTLSYDIFRIGDCGCD